MLVCARLYLGGDRLRPVANRHCVYSPVVPRLTTVQHNCARQDTRGSGCFVPNFAVYLVVGSQEWVIDACLCY